MGLTFRLGATLLTLLALAVASCGGSDSEQILERQESSPVEAEDAVAERELVSEETLNDAPPGSVERAFLEYWAAISVEDWATAVRYLDQSFRESLEAKHVSTALQTEAANNAPVKPIVRDVTRARRLTRVRYFVRVADGSLKPTSTAWARRGGQWLIVYSATLVDSYAAAVQQGVQDDINPSAAEPSREAIRAGAAGRRAQSELLAPP